MFGNKNNNKKIIYAYDDTKKWGRQLVETCKKQGIKAKLFKKTWSVPNRKGVVVFFRMRNIPECMEKDKKFAKKLAGKDKILMIPRINEACLYDNKVAQAKLFKKWMPETFYVTSKEEAEEILSKLNYPFISKAKQGSGSANVRLIKNKKEAHREIYLAFTGDGIPCSYKIKQENYLLWQEFMPNNSYDWRIYLIANKYSYISKRANRENIPFASGSGVSDKIVELSSVTRQLLDFTYEFSKANNFSFLAVDIVRNKQNHFVILEASCAWAKKKKRSRFFELKEGEWQPMEYFSDNMFDIIVRAINKGEFNCD